MDFNGAEGDRIQLSDTETYTVADWNGQTLLQLSTGGTVGLAGVAPSAFHSDWVVFS
jgi:hypothetical protein